MIRLELSKGSIVKFKNQAWVITKILDLEKNLVKNLITTETGVADIADLRPLEIEDIKESSYDCRDQVFDKDWKIAERRLEITKPLIIAGQRSKMEKQ